MAFPQNLSLLFFQIIQFPRHFVEPLAHKLYSLQDRIQFFVQFLLQNFFKILPCQCHFFDQVFSVNRSYGYLPRYRYIYD